MRPRTSTPPSHSPNNGARELKWDVESGSGDSEGDEEQEEEDENDDSGDKLERYECMVPFVFPPFTST